MIGVQIDTRSFNEAVKKYVKVSGKNMAEVLNQRMLNVLGGAFDRIPPSDPQAERSKIRAFLRQELLTHIAFGSLRKSRKAKTFKIAKTAKERLTRGMLIYQARRAHKGLPGLYGDKMRQGISKFYQKMQVRVGYLKSLFIPAIRRLNPICQYKFPYQKTGHIARWPGSAGYSVTNPAKPAEIQEVVTEIGAKVGSRGRAAEGIVNKAIQESLRNEEKEIVGQIIKYLSKAAE